MGATYSPVLKAKDAEIKILSTSPHSHLVTPIFEMQKAAKATMDQSTGKQKRSKSTSTDASYFLDDVARQWHRPSYLDVHRVTQPMDKPSWWRLFSVLKELGSAIGPVAPVFHLGDGAAAAHAAAPLAETAGRAALRIRMPHPNIPALSSEITSIATSLWLSPEQVDIIIDWEDRLEQHSMADLEAGTVAAIASLQGHHGTVITVGTANTDHCKQAGDWEIPRREWLLWRRLITAGIDVTFGDYALYPPSDPVPAGPQYGHLRYSYEDTLWVHRRAKPGKSDAAAGLSTGLAGAFRRCSDHLVRSDHFCGAGFSGADQTIKEAALGTTKVGAAGVWREISLEHHLALVSKQLADPAEPSAAA